MYLARLVFSSVATLLLLTAALAYVPRQIGQQRIYVDDPGHAAAGYSAYRIDTVPADTVSDSAAAGTSDPYHQRYYSQSEGWTYYTLPSLSSGR